jgi:hypothetical protein
MDRIYYSHLDNAFRVSLKLFLRNHTVDIYSYDIKLSYPQILRAIVKTVMNPGIFIKETEFLDQPSEC